MWTLKGSVGDEKPFQGLALPNATRKHLEALESTFLLDLLHVHDSICVAH
jgi:hypothetical protein